MAQTVAAIESGNTGDGSDGRCFGLSWPWSAPDIPRNLPLADFLNRRHGNYRNGSCIFVSALCSGERLKEFSQPAPRHGKRVGRSGRLGHQEGHCDHCPRIYPNDPAAGEWSRARKKVQFTSRGHTGEIIAGMDLHNCNLSTLPPSASRRHRSPAEHAPKSRSGSSGRHSARQPCQPRIRQLLPGGSHA